MSPLYDWVSTRRSRPRRLGRAARSTTIARSA